MVFDDATAAVMVSALRGYEARNLAISNNLANVETPGYRRTDVLFETALASASREAHAGARGRSRVESAGIAASVMPQIAPDPGTAMRTDASNVDPDTEMAALSQNQLAHQTVTSLLDKHLGLIRAAIIGRQ
jgi:flagellar basal-body rod protein FlgB